MILNHSSNASHKTWHMSSFFHLQSSDFVIILNQRRAVDAFSKGGNLTLGGNCTVAVGPLGRYVCWFYSIIPHSVARGQNNAESRYGNVRALSKCPPLSISVVIWHDTFITKVFFIWMHLKNQRLWLKEERFNLCKEIDIMIVLC